MAVDNRYFVVYNVRDHKLKPRLWHIFWHHLPYTDLWHCWFFDVLYYGLQPCFPAKYR